ncbi:sulfurtransferase [Desulfuromonas versatilis]|uniref:Sulfurtransferase n=1 Tax=Desulfuromonas versatilis TaxID=2802975 RepID=A0ABM8HVR8_9BACT|nr:rhodanese-like domain-containing protein [Desulfuromonas versatilis]BCR06053.1 sulfurtransferase [Desulfuromonas versatilis]
MSAEFRRIALEAVVIFVLGVVLGLSFNTQLVMDAFSGKVKAPLRLVQEPPADEGNPNALRFPIPVELAQVRELLAGGAIAVDARAWEVYLEGHLPGAWSLPLGEVDSALAGFAAKVPRDAVLVIYCSGFGCPDSFDLGVRLLTEGYEDVRVYEGGFPEWRDAGLNVEKGEP